MKTKKVEKGVIKKDIESLTAFIFIASIMFWCLVASCALAGNLHRM